MIVDSDNLITHFETDQVSHSPSSQCLLNHSVHFSTSWKSLSPLSQMLEWCDVMTPFTVTFLLTTFYILISMVFQRSLFSCSSCQLCFLCIVVQFYFLKAFEINRYLLSKIASSRNSWTRVVKIHEVSSIPNLLTSGAIQGSVFGPLALTVLVNDIFDNALHAKPFMYAYELETVIT